MHHQREAGLGGSRISLDGAKIAPGLNRVRVRVTTARRRRLRSRSVLCKGGCYPRRRFPTSLRYTRAVLVVAAAAAAAEVPHTGERLRGEVSLRRRCEETRLTRRQRTTSEDHGRRFRSTSTTSRSIHGTKNPAVDSHRR